jgi:hypothetical protein
MTPITGSSTLRAAREAARAPLRPPCFHPAADVCRAHVKSVKKMIPEQSHRVSHTQLIKRCFDGLAHAAGAFMTWL